MTPDANFLSGTAVPGPYKTQLPLADEVKFQQWVKQNRVPFDDSPKSDYDMRGFWQAAQQGKASTQINPSDNQVHYPDTWKTPYHKSFSGESKYASNDTQRAPARDPFLPNYRAQPVSKGAPSWSGDDKNGYVLRDKLGTIVQNERTKEGRKYYGE